MQSEYSPYVEIITSQYLQSALTPGDIKIIVKRLIAKLKHLDFEAIAFQGYSGALIAPIVAYKMNKCPILVRKETFKDAHSCQAVEGLYSHKRIIKYIIIDDFIDTGTTIRNINYKINQTTGTYECIGVALYAWHTCDIQKEIWINDDCSLPIIKIKHSDLSC